jgi:hypothetical protein
VWTPCSKIAYTTLDNSKVVVISQTDQVIKQTNMTMPCRISVSADNIMYLADWAKGAYQYMVSILITCSRYLMKANASR